MVHTIDLTGKTGLVLGVANHRSIAWAISQALSQAGARLAFTYQNDRFKVELEKLTAHLDDPLLLPCDVTREEEIKATLDVIEKQMGSLSVMVHCIAFAQRGDLVGDFSKTSREGFGIALEVSAYSLVAVARYAAPLMERDGGSIVTLTFQASERVFPGYNVMGMAKAALENAVKQLAAELGPSNIRVNAISAGPLDTLSGRGIRGFLNMKSVFTERAPLRRNITHQEVAKATLFLCSDLASGITGQVIRVDTGYSIMGI